MVVANFTADTPICAPVNVVFFNLSLGASSYFWDFGDGNFSSLTAPTHVYQNSGPGIINNTVVLTATSSFGCAETFTHTYAIFPTPQVSFIATPQTQLFPATTVTITNTTPNAASFTNNWDFDDNQTSTNVFPTTVTYSTWGDYIITLVTSSQFCRDSISDTVRILPPIPIAAFEGTGTGCRPYSITFQNNSQFGSTFTWNFGDGSSSSAVNPTHIYFNPGVYDVTLTVVGDGGTVSIVGIDSVIVYDLPQPAFIATPTTASAGTDPIVLTNISQNAISYIWDFGDGSPQEVSVSPTHIYEEEGSYQITLIATSADGCVDTFKLASLITINEETSLNVPNAFSPNLSGPSGGVFDPLSTTNDIFHPVIKGVKNYELSIYSRWGELLFESKDAKVGWDGYYKGKICTQDVYIWKIKASTFDGTQLNEAGDLLLLRK
jgi:gliding motility-associated-like protein